MSKFAILLLTLAITASVTVAPAMAETAKKHRSHIRGAFALSGPGQVWLAPVPSGPKLPRSFPKHRLQGMASLWR